MTPRGSVAAGCASSGFPPEGKRRDAIVKSGPGPRRSSSFPRSTHRRDGGVEPGTTGARPLVPLPAVPFPGRRSGLPSGRNRPGYPHDPVRERPPLASSEPSSRGSVTGGTHALPKQTRRPRGTLSLHLPGWRERGQCLGRCPMGSLLPLGATSLHGLLEGHRRPC